MKIHVFKATDTAGNVVEGVVGETSETLFLSGLKDKDGESQTFEGEAYHVYSWAQRFDVAVDEHTITLDLDKMAVVDWFIQGTDHSK